MSRWQFRIAKQFASLFCLESLSGKGLNPYDLPISARLETVFKRNGIERLGDLHGLSQADLRRRGRCGLKTTAEIFQLVARAEKGEFTPTAKPFSKKDTAGLLLRFDEILSKLPDHGKALLLHRLGAETGRASWLKDTGKRFGLSGERVRQIVFNMLLLVRKTGGPKLRSQLVDSSRIYSDLACPLTPGLLEVWMNKSRKPRFCLSFYVRLIGELEPGLSAWPNEQEPHTGPEHSISKAVYRILAECPKPLSVKEAFQRTQKPGQNLFTFLQALKHSKELVVEFSNPERPTVKLRRLPRPLLFSEAAISILEKSTAPLHLNEIKNLIRKRHGNKVHIPELAQDPSKFRKDRLYLLGRSTFGFRSHIKLPEKMWKKVQLDIQQLLEKEKRPLSTADMLECGFQWARKTNRYELAYVLRDDQRFQDLGRLLFSLASWNLRGRERLEDLILRVLADNKDPLTAKEIHDRIRQLRSVSRSGVSSTIRKIKSVCRSGMGRYSLKGA
jgi:predicted Zn-ribbon and HTH transcriptional regulator